MGTIQLASVPMVPQAMSQIHVPTDTMPFLSVEDEVLFGFM